ncbi:MAG: hypothetical protein SGJ11_08895 [Phycisphaerae bacterium]|nr:hypothetical protein [Phycisphaerae bacterium]
MARFLSLPALVSILVSALLAIVCVAGCANPTIGIRSITVKEQTADSLRLDVEVAVTNPASRPMRLLQWDYMFVESATDGGAAYHGRWEALATVPPGETMTRHVPVVLTGSGGAPAGPWQVRGTLSFRSPSRFAEIFYDLGLYRPETGFSGGAASSSAAAAAAAPEQSDSAAP